MSENLRIADAPLMPQAELTEDVKIPTGGKGNFSVNPDMIAEYTVESKDLADKEFVNNSSNGVRQLLEQHLDDENNPHVVTKSQVGLGNVDNTSDLNKPISNATQSALNSKADSNNVVNSVNGQKGAVTVSRSSLGIPTDQEIKEFEKEARLVTTDSDQNQQEINDFGGYAKYKDGRVYEKNQYVMLDNGDVVKAVEDGVSSNPNLDMTGWEPTSNTWVDTTKLFLTGASSAAWNTLVLLSAIEKAKSQSSGIYCAPRGTVHLSGNIDFSLISNIKFYANIQNTTGTIIVGGFSTTAVPADITFKNISNGTSTINGAIPSIDTFRIEGIKSGFVSIGSTNLSRIHAVGGSSTKGSNAYFTLNLGGAVRAFRVSDEGSGGWNNRIRVNGGRLIDLDVTGTGYTPNELLFDDNTFEGSLVKIRFKRAWTNRITNARFENVSSAVGVIFEEDTLGNTIIQRWSGSGSTRSQFGFSPNVVDLGQGNNCTTQNAIEFNKVELFSVSGNSLILSNSVDSFAYDSRIGKPYAGRTNKNLIKPALIGFYTQANRNIATSDLVPVIRGDAVKFNASYEGSKVRVAVYIFDEKQSLITTGENHISLAGGTFNPTSGSYSVTTDIPENNLGIGFGVDSSDVAYIRVVVYTTTNTTINNISATLFTQTLGRFNSNYSVGGYKKLPTLNGLPTEGFAPEGLILLDSSNGKLAICSSSLDTNTTIASSGNVVTVIRTTGISVGAIVGVLGSDGVTVWTTASEVTSSTINLAVSVTVNSGSRVVANNWQYVTP